MCIDIISDPEKLAQFMFAMIGVANQNLLWNSFNYNDTLIQNLKHQWMVYCYKCISIAYSKNINIGIKKFFLYIIIIFKCHSDTYYKSMNF